MTDKKFIAMMIRILKGFATPTDVKDQFAEFKLEFSDPQTSMLAYTVQWARMDTSIDCIRERVISSRMDREGLIRETRYGTSYRFNVLAYHN